MKFALIPARSGSKRIPNKNIKHFCGKPIIGYAIEVAKQSGLFDEVIVSTDSKEIAQIAESFGATAPFIRPEDISDDYTGTREVISHAIKELANQGQHFDMCCCIYATSPLLTEEYLQQAFQALTNDASKAFAFSVTTFEFPVQRALKIDHNGLGPMFPAFVQSRSQDLDEAYHDAGQFYWGRSEDFLSRKQLFSEHSIGVKIPRHLVQDIDTPEDWDRAELMYKTLHQSK